MFDVLFLDNLIADISKSNSIFGCLYEKKDGTITQFNCRFNVVKHLRGGKRTIPQRMYVVWDNNRKGYRALEPSRILRLTHKGKTYGKVADNQFIHYL